MYSIQSCLFRQIPFNFLDFSSLDLANSSSQCLFATSLYFYCFYLNCSNVLLFSSIYSFSVTIFSFLYKSARSYFWLICFWRRVFTQAYWCNFFSLRAAASPIIVSGVKPVLIACFASNFCWSRSDSCKYDGVRRYKLLLNLHWGAFAQQSDLWTVFTCLLSLQILYSFRCHQSLFVFDGPSGDAC